MARKATGRRGRSPGSELVLVSGGKSQMRKASARSWSKAKQSRFLSALVETCNVTRACEEAGVSQSHAYRRRKADAAFRAGWMEALGIAYNRLEMVLLERALNGTERIVTKVDGREERMREYPNQIALSLLKMHRETAVAALAEPPESEVEEVRERLLDKLERLHQRRKAEIAADQDSATR